MRKASIGVCVVCVAALIAPGCSDSGNPGGPSGNPPPPTATSITVTLRDVVLVGTSAAATGTATMSNGQSQAVTAGWRSDVPAVAAVTDAGNVTGVSNGEANIFVVFGGVQGSRRVRVAPNYDGRWTGSQRITRCTDSGDLAGLCNEGGGVIGVLFPVGLVARQPGALMVSGEFTIEEFGFPTFSTQVEGDGAIRFSSVAVSDGVRAEVSWQMNSTQDARANGTIREVYTAPGILSGDLTYESTLDGFNRGGGGAVPAGPTRTRLAGLRRVVRDSRR